MTLRRYGCAGRTRFRVPWDLSGSEAMNGVGSRDLHVRAPCLHLGSSLSTAHSTATAPLAACPPTHRRLVLQRPMTYRVSWQDPVYPSLVVKSRLRVLFPVLREAGMFCFGRAAYCWCPYFAGVTMAYSAASHRRWTAQLDIPAGKIWSEVDEREDCDRVFPSPLCRGQIHVAVQPFRALSYALPQLDRPTSRRCHR